VVASLRNFKASVSCYLYSPSHGSPASRHLSRPNVAPIMPHSQKSGVVLKRESWEVRALGSKK
jgi:hypothetical protein